MVVVAANHQTLPDGSTVDLKEGADIDVAFTPGVRAVTLRHGTAHFQITKNPLRPFVVTAAGVTVRAVGTAFCVGIESKSVEVIVTEGRVSVAQSTHDSRVAIESARVPDSVLVDIGEHVMVESITGAAQPSVFTVAPLGAQELAEKLSWLNPRLEFTGTPMGVVIMMFNQRNRQQLRLDDPILQNLQLSGVLRSDNIPALLQLLDANFHIRAEYRGSNEIILRKAP
jgi:transmembrane sensor